MKLLKIRHKNIQRSTNCYFVIIDRIESLTTEKRQFKQQAKENRLQNEEAGIFHEQLLF